MTESESNAEGGGSAESDAGVWAMAKGLAETLRPHQWVKNLFVLAPLFFAQEYDDPTKVGLGISAAGLFCLAAGSVYLINDIFDVEEDRQHPVKRHRPIPSGRLPIPVAKVAAGVLSIGTVGTCFLIEPWLAAAVGGYLVMNLAYSTVLKHVAFVDVSIIAIGFVLRVLAGQFATGIPVSRWLIGCTFLLALYLGLGKRVHEYHMYAADEDKDSRKVLESYGADVLEFAFLFVGGLTVAVYTIYTMTAAVPELTDSLEVKGEMLILRENKTPFQTPYLPISVLFTVFGITRFYQLVQSDVAESPTDLIIKDLPFVVNLAIWGCFMLYVGLIG